MSKTPTSRHHTIDLRHCENQFISQFCGRRRVVDVLLTLPAFIYKIRESVVLAIHCIKIVIVKSKIVLSSSLYMITNLSVSKNVHESVHSVQSLSVNLVQGQTIVKSGKLGIPLET